MALMRPRQRSLYDELEVPLHEVTFCAVDLETTSVSHRDGEIVEIGAVKSRAGEVLGTFQTFVRPSTDLPLEIQLLTGITPSMLDESLPLPAVLPSFVEFCGASVFVAHNARFDRSFLDTACRRLDYEISGAPVVDTARLARRLLRDEVRNCRLATLASHFRTSHTPNHRAFPDAAACLEVLWALLERAAAYGVTTLADLLEIQSVRSNPHAEKVKMARKLPTTRGVYLFENGRREVIYVGKAANLRARVRSYFTSDERKRMGNLRAEVADVRIIGCASEVEAAGLEARLIERHRPRYNRVGVRRRTPVYLKLTKERHPRLAVARKVGPADGALYIGPFSSTARARSVGATLSGLFGLRACSLRLGGVGMEPCALYALGSCHGPCTEDDADVAAHHEAVRVLRRDLLTGGLGRTRALARAKLSALASRERFEEAAAHRDAIDELARVADRARRLRALRAAGRIEIQGPEGAVTLVGGRLADAPPPPQPDPDGIALATEGLGERQAVASWLEKASPLRMLGSTSPLAYPWPRAQPLAELGPLEAESQIRLLSALNKAIPSEYNERPYQAEQKDPAGKELFPTHGPSSKTQGCPDGQSLPS